MTGLLRVIEMLGNSIALLEEQNSRLQAELADERRKPKVSVEHAPVPEAMS
jgi:hypothetical protein